MRLDKQDRTEDHDDRANGRRIRPPLYDTRMIDDQQSTEKGSEAHDKPPDKDSNNRLTKSR